MKKINAGILLAVTILAGMVFVHDNVSANDTSVTTTTIKVAESCSITSTLDTPHIAYLPAGIYSGNYNSDGHDYRNGIGKTTIKAFCNDSAGFSIYAIGYTNDTFGNNTLIGPDNNTIVTGTGTSGETSNWAMKIGTVAGTYAPTLENGYGSFKAVPSTYDKVASFNSVTDLTNGSAITTTYAAYIASTQSPGTYNGKVKYTLVHPVDETPLQPQVTESGKICYYPNASTYEGTMGCQTIPASGTINGVSSTSATLLTGNFSRSGYGFAGWSDTFDYNTNPNANFYGPNEDITFTAGQYTGSNSGLSLYAVWVKSAGSLQDSSKVVELCGTGANALTQAPTDGTANLSSVSALTDSRDNQTYAIAKLADGNCWMIENLRLADTHQESGNSVATTLTTSNTNNPLNDGTTVTLKHNYTDTDTFSTLSATSAVAYDASTALDGWCTTNSAACDDQSRIRTDNTANRATGNPNVNTGSMYSYGNYYNWYSATAGNGTYSKSSGEVAGDLCPSGWKLPYGNSSGSGNTAGGFYYLNYKLNNDSNVTDGTASKQLRSYPNNYLYSGYVYGGSLNNRGSYGRYWSSTACSSGSAYYLSLRSSGVSPGTNNYVKCSGWAVRCIAQ